MVGIGGVVRLPLSTRGGPRDETFNITLGPRTEQNPFSGELAAVGQALISLREIRYRKIIFATRNKAAVLALKHPRQQSGQQYISQAYDAISTLRKAGNTISVVWIPAGTQNELWNIAKAKAKEATRQKATPQTQEPAMRPTTFRSAFAKRASPATLPDKVGKLSKRVDTALPGKHTRRLYDQLSHKEASVLAQLRTGMAKLNTYLYRIRATSSDQCVCGKASETVEHFMFRCNQWTEHRTEMLQCTNVHRGNISFYLGGKSPSDADNWSPNMRAVRAAIRFAIATGRLDADKPQNGTP
jgi:ribonuclease HI